MKNWFARWFGGATRPDIRPATTPDMRARPAPLATAPRSPSPCPPLAATDAPGANAALDAAFYGWLADAAGAASPAPEASERLILDELGRLADDPARAAGLVPRVPAVIPALLRSLRDDSVSNADLSRMVAQDVVLVAEIVREANSPWYRPPTPIRNIEGAVMLLGQNGLRMLLARVAFRPVIGMGSGRFAKHMAPRVWMQSECCALAAATLAPHAGVDPFEAYLAGLVQNVGLVVAFRLIDQIYSDDVLPRSDAFRAALLAQARRLAHAIAIEWAFPPAVAGAIADAGLPDARAPGAVLATADALAKLRLLVDAGALAAGDPLVDAIVTPRLRPCFDLLLPQET